MYNSIIQAECVTLKELNHLFIDLEYKKVLNKNLNLYRSRSYNQKNKKYLQYDEVKEALKLMDKSKLKYIYLVGKDPLTHSDFNQILRLSLTYAPVTIYSDGNCINDKKARFLKRVEDEGTNEIIFKIFINHYDEKINDERATRGSYRKAIHAINSLNKYGFNPILAILKSKEDNETELKEGFKELGKKFKFETEEINFCIIPQVKSNNTEEPTQPENTNYENIELDCKSSRLLTKNGVYTCPILANDYRGRSGANLKDFSKKCYLETAECRQCIAHATNIFTNNWITD